MARIRTIKPDFFQSEDVAVLSYRARLTWIGLWTHVDDEGRCKANPRLIKGALWPLEDDVTASNVSEDIRELAENGKLTVYSVDGEDYMQILNWTKHQRISRPSESKFPAPHEASPSTQGGLTESSVNENSPIVKTQSQKPRNQAEASSSMSTHAQFTEPSLNPQRGNNAEREVEVEKEVEGEGETRKRSPRTIPDDFHLTSKREAWAKENAPGVNIKLQTDNFIDYWRNGDGSNKKKTNWESTWRNWMRKKQEDAELRGWKPPTQNRPHDPKRPQGW